MSGKVQLGYNPLRPVASTVISVGGIVCVLSSHVPSPITDHDWEGTGYLLQRETITYCGVNSVQRFHNPGIFGVN